VIQGVGPSDFGNTSGVVGLSFTSSIDWPSTSSTSYLLHRGTWEHEVGKDEVRLLPQPWTGLHSLL